MHKHTSHCTRGLSLEERLLHYLPERVEDSCWVWTGTTNRRGYGVFNIGKTQYRAHRAAYEVWMGPIPEGLTIDHVKDRGCGSTLCCNPAHLEAVTAIENVRRGSGLPMQYARAEKCIHGHPFSGDNLGTRQVGDKTYRDCITCRRRRQRIYDSKRRPRQKTSPPT